MVLIMMMTAMVTSSRYLYINPIHLTLIFLHETAMKNYPLPSIILHWLTVCAVVVAYITSGDPTDNHGIADVILGQIHVASGLLLIPLVFLRLFFRVYLGVPKSQPESHLWHLLVSTAQSLLYLLMLLVPLAGLISLMDKTQTYVLAGISLPSIKPTMWLSWLGDIHPFLGNAFVIMAGIHGLAALWHHYYLRDHTLKSMLPWTR